MSKIKNKNNDIYLLLGCKYLTNYLNIAFIEHFYFEKCLHS
jgi:hypothetical protein